MVFIPYCHCLFLFLLYIYLFIFKINLYYVLSLYITLVLLLSLIILSMYFLKFFINFEDFFYLYILFMYSLFLVSILVYYYSIDSVFKYSFSTDMSRSILNMNTGLVSLQLDNVSCVFSCVTIQIAFFVNVYSFFYNKNNQDKFRFFFLLNFFFLSMVFLIHSSNFILLFFFWEMISLSSYLLINFNHYKTISYKSSLKSLFFNIISDVFLLLSIVVYYNITNTFVINDECFYVFVRNTISYKFFFFNLSSVFIFSLFISIPAFIKSSQIFFHFWLPDSMEAPLPASALIHSATLIASGIYLFFKFFFIISKSSNLVIFFSFYFCITYVFGAAVSLFNTDVKKILAYSTISNCGLMFLSILLGSKINTLTYFSVHGWYKSISFIIAGHLVMSFNHSQDLRKIINNRYLVFLKSGYFIITVFFLSSHVYLSSSLFKHLIFQNQLNSFFLNSFIIIGTCLSFSYSLKILVCYNYSNNKSKKIDIVFDFYEFYNILVYILFISLSPVFYFSIIGGYVSIKLVKIVLYLNIWVMITLTSLI